MSETETPRITPEDLEDAVEEAYADNGTADDPRQRAKDCVQAINEALAKYHCRIMPQLLSEPIGNGGVVSKALIEATYDVFPNQVGGER